MTRWSIGTNSYYYEGSILLEEAPWYVFLIEYLIDIVCNYFPSIPLPNIKIKRYNETYTLKEYYGTTFDLFHLYIHMPIFNWCYSKIKYKDIKFPYQMLEEYFSDKIEKTDFLDYDEESIKKIEENKKYSEELYEEFKVIYEKLRIFENKIWK